MNALKLGKMFKSAVLVEAASAPDFKLSEMTPMFKSAVRELSLYLDRNCDSRIPRDIRNYVNSELVDELQCTDKVKTCTLMCRLGSVELYEYAKYWDKTHNPKLCFGAAASTGQLHVMKHIADDHKFKLEDYTWGASEAFDADRLDSLLWILERIGEEKTPDNLHKLLTPSVKHYNKDNWLEVAEASDATKITQWLIDNGSAFLVPLRSRPRGITPASFRQDLPGFRKNYTEILGMVCANNNADTLEILLAEHEYVRMEYLLGYSIAAKHGAVTCVLMLAHLVSRDTLFNTTNDNSISQRVRDAVREYLKND